MKRYLSELIYGGMDGIITTIAIIGAALGSQLNNEYIVMIGGSSLVADGLSMGISRYNSLLDDVDSSCKGKKINAIYSGMATFIYFLVFGMIPLIPFIFFHQLESVFSLFLICSAVSFLIIGWIKGEKSGKKTRDIISTILLGSAAASISYYIARDIKSRM